MDPKHLAQCYEKDHLPHWDGVLTEWLLEALPDQVPERVAWLELCCSSGALTAELAGRLPAGGRLIAIDEVRELMELARQKVPPERRRQVFFTKERPDALSFSDSTVDGVLAAGVPPVYELEQVVREAYRLLGKDGRLLLGVALRGSFQEIFDVLREVLEKEDLNPALEGLEKLARRFPDAAEAGRLLSRQGFIECRVRQRTHQVRFDSAMELVSSSLVRRNCLEACLALIPDRGWREGVLAGLVAALAVYFPGGIDVTLQFGRLEATRL